MNVVGGRVGQLTSVFPKNLAESIRRVPLARTAMLLIGASVVTVMVALASAPPSQAIFECPGTDPPQQWLPINGKVIQKGELVEFAVENTPGMSSTCMWVAVSKDGIRAPEGWYQNPIDRCHPVQKIVNDKFYFCVSENSDWRNTPGKYYWTTYKINTECMPSACYSPIDWEITVADSGGGSRVVTKFSLSKRKMRRGKKIKIKATLSIASKLKIRVDKKSKGRKVGKKCKKATKKRRKKKSCNRYTKIGTLSYSAKAGANTFTFKGKVGKKKLKRGTYRFTPSAKDSAGKTSKGKSVTLKVR